jgi:hypothetical protein
MSAVPVHLVLEGVENGIVHITLTAVAPHRQVAQASQSRSHSLLQVPVGRTKYIKKNSFNEKFHAQIRTIQMVNSKEVDTIADHPDPH